nr:MAG TPA: hypothetical protein [Caudoviricetes sp.]
MLRSFQQLERFPFKRHHLTAQSLRPYRNC